MTMLSDKTLAVRCHRWSACKNYLIVWYEEARKHG